LCGKSAALTGNGIIFTNIFLCKSGAASGDLVDLPEQHHYNTEEVLKDLRRWLVSGKLVAVLAALFLMSLALAACGQPAAEEPAAEGEGQQPEGPVEGGTVTLAM